jgi:phage gp36-like protein
MMNGKAEKMWGYLMQNFREHLLQKPTIPKYDCSLARYLSVKEREPDKERQHFMLEIKENC